MLRVAFQTASAIVLLCAASLCAAAAEPVLVYTGTNQQLTAGIHGVEMGMRVGGSVGAGVAGGAAVAAVGALLLSGEGVTVSVMQKDFGFFCASDNYKIKPENIHDDLAPLTWYAISKNDNSEWVIAKPTEAQAAKIEAHPCWNTYTNAKKMAERKQ